MNYFVYILLLTSIYFLIMAAINYIHSHDPSVFFYHSLVSPLKQHAIQFSILVFTGIVYTLQNTRQNIYKSYKTIHISLAIYFIVFILLLSSKLIISYTVVFFLYYLVSYVKKNSINRLTAFVASIALVTTTALILFTKNPVSTRFNEIITGDIGLVAEDKYNPGMYFNGLQFRLLQWRIVAEILNENKSWITGVSPGRAQQLLDEKYRLRNMYIGDGATDLHGFLGYNCHNQLLESTLQTGILGLIAFLLICFGMLALALKTKNIFFTALIILLLANTFIESVFETQYGLMIYTFLPLFLYKLMQTETPSGRLLEN